ncbi:replication initiation and membrane attachment family protein [Ornithinibacillus halophilus]|uniref:Replicative DNA helicase loader DnaB n=1 Tax=Ornithinibacillus halophilus TaxID=930117 RepID=A0A1M5N698_9BACI|nr:DnaD domain protein [Ornithinibacillus halophilus]SHG84523.1 replicative DNA helicase loader DnaB [Ornithinibacillus halophilus]
MNYIGKILPVDGYYVQLIDNTLPIDYEKSLTHLYQPLIGMQAVMLYQTLLHEIELQSSAQTHHTLMSYLSIPLDEIYEARLKLEGIGLLKTLEKNTEHQTVYVYSLIRPFSPKEFFQDAMLTQLLFHHIGKQKFDMLKSHYADEKYIEGTKDITASFHDVFDTFKPTVNHVQPAPRQQEVHGPNIETIDFSWMEQMLKQRMIPAREVLNEENRRIITQMMTLYDLASHEIEKSVLWALTDENRLDVQEFQEACHDLFKQKQSQQPIHLVEKSNTGQSSEQIDQKKPKTKEEQLIYELENISPKQLLEDLSSGNHASDQDLKVIREVMTTQGLPSPVMNVLIHYVLLQSNMKLSKAYLEKIASHWSRANLKTAKEAMVFAKKEKDRYRKTNSKQGNNSYYNKARSNEVVPEWFKERKTKKTKEVNPPNQQDLEKEKEEIAALLRQYSSSTKNNHLQG